MAKKVSGYGEMSGEELEKGTRSGIHSRAEPAKARARVASNVDGAFAAL